MSLLGRLRGRSTSEAPGARDPGAPEADALAIEGYEGLSDKQVTDQLHELSQVELSDVHRHERAHRARRAVLNKLGYLRRKEPLPGYDKLDADQVVRELATADAEGVRAIRDYERKFGQRRQVLDEAARVLPDAEPSANETQLRQEKADRVRTSMRRGPGRR